MRNMLDGRICILDLNFNLEDKVVVNGGSNVRTPHLNDSKYSSKCEEINSVRTYTYIMEENDQGIKIANVRMGNCIIK